jgi:hypothetical protein
VSTARRTGAEKTSAEHAVLTTAVVRDLASFGPFFAVHTHTPGSAPRKPWRAMSELVEDPEILKDRVAAVRARLAAATGQPPNAVELRVAASVTHLGLVARLISPVHAVAVTSGALLEVNLPSTWWQPQLGGAFPLSVPRHVHADAINRDAKFERLACMLATHILNGPIRNLVQATMALSVSAHILWGNVASALNGAASMIATCQPAWTDRSRLIASLLLDQPPLRHTSTNSVNGSFRRRSCCLIYRTTPNTPAAVCGDCILFHGERRV